MQKLVVLDLTLADIALFEAYERKIMPLLSKYGARLEQAIRSIDGMTETHLLYFPENVSFEKFLSDPSRAALKDEWKLTGVTTTITDVEQIDYL